MRPVDAERHVAKFTGRVVLAAYDLAVNHDTHSDAIRDADKDNVVEGRTVTIGRPYLRKRAGLARILEMNIDAVKFALKRFEQVNISPLQCRCVKHHTRLAIKHAGNDDAHSVADRVVRDVTQGPSYLDAERLDEFLRFDHRGKTHNVADLFADRIGDHQICPRRPNIDRDRQTFLRIKIEKCRLTPANLLAALGALAHQIFFEKLIYKESHVGTIRLHQPGKIGA